jgi:uncharacterized protein YmfQ (DUF2313 family)
MRVPVYVVADFVAAFQNLLPRGRAWSRETTSVQAGIANALMPTFQRFASRAADLLTDAFPSTTCELLPEWEATLGLPDDCAPPNQTLEQRQQAVRAKFVARGGQDVSYYVRVAAALDFTITVTEYQTFRAGRSVAGDACCGSWAPFEWTVNASPLVESFFEAGSSVAGDALAIWGNSELECTLDRIKPGHTCLNFTYHN